MNQRVAVPLILRSSSDFMSGKTLKINETFASIQGESTYAGRLCFFIRLCKCNLTCSYCDTMYAHSEEADNYKEVTVETLVHQVLESGIKLVEITGGEPLLQGNVIELINQLLEHNFEVMMETNGSKDISVVDTRVKRILDCKLPSSKMSDFNLYRNYQYLTSHDEVKFVMGNREDYEFARAIIEKYDLLKKSSNLLFSPIWGQIEFKQIVEWMLEDKLDVRFQLQMHKLIWGQDTQGV